MASQPLYQPYSPTNLAPAVRPNISVAFSNGAAAIAVGRALATLPMAARDATLDEIAIAEEASKAISMAKASLSPAMYEAFLRWGAASSRLASAYEDDEEGAVRFGHLNQALEQIYAVPAAGSNDTAF